MILQGFRQTLTPEQPEIQAAPERNDAPQPGRRSPLVEMTTTCHGRNLPLFCKAVRTACSMPPQQGTSMRTTVTLLILFSRMITASFSL